MATAGVLTAPPLEPSAPPLYPDLQKFEKELQNDIQAEARDPEYGRQGATRDETVNWFRRKESKKIQSIQGIPKWFHGIITRIEAEEILKTKKVGTYMIRISESRFGYTLSLTSGDEFIVRHYMIDQTVKNGHYMIIGEPKAFSSLGRLIAHYKKTELSNWRGVLVESCSQTRDSSHYNALMGEDDQLPISSSNIPPPLPVRNKNDTIQQASPQRDRKNVRQKPIQIANQMERSKVRSDSDSSEPPPLPPRTYSTSTIPGNDITPDDDNDSDTNDVSYTEIIAFTT